ncbi:MAG: RDD family protein [Opitutaceae bacterium]|nr:RDD family protein [Opitutaceae bacterium]
MNSSFNRFVRGFPGLLGLLLSVSAYTQEAPIAPAAPEPASNPETVVAAPSDPTAEAQSTPAPEPPASPSRRGRSTDVVLAFNRDAFHGTAGGTAEAVVAVGGSCRVEGNVRDAVVAVLGDARVDGEVGDSVVAVVGNVYLNNRAETAVAVFGGVELGPKAVVREVVSIGGPVIRHPGSQVLGTINELSIVSEIPDYTGFRAWVRKCLFLGRPLAIGANLGWAWTVAGIFLAVYIVFSVIFSRGVERCIDTLDTRPGRSFFAAVVSLILMPIVAVVLSLTVIGFFLAVALILFAIIFGKAAVFGWLGRRMMRGLGLSSMQSATALAVLLGGSLAAAIYLVPVMGMMVWVLMLVLAHGVGVYTLLLSLRRPRPAGPSAPAEVVRSETPVRPGAATAGDHADEPVAAMGASTGFVPASVSGAGGLESAAVGLGTVSPESAPAPGAKSVPPLPEWTGYARAGFWIRVAALAIDVTLVGSIAVLMSLGPLFLLALATYGAVMWRLKGTTIGGIVCGLKVVRTNDDPLDWTVAVVRALGCFLSLLVAGLGFIWVAFDDEKQGWHDKIAGTFVVRVPAGVSLV